jgi:hypothetical protein
MGQGLRGSGFKGSGVEGFMVQGFRVQWFRVIFSMRVWYFLFLLPPPTPPIYR